MHLRTVIVAGVGTALFWLCLAAPAQSVESTTSGTRITASGEATVSVKPDEAMLSIGVTTKRPPRRRRSKERAGDREASSGSHQSPGQRRGL